MMTERAIPGYSHTQKSPLCLLVYRTAIALIAGAWAARDEYPIALIVGGSRVLTTAFHHLAVEDQGDRLAVRFGSLPLFRRTVRYADTGKPCPPPI